jgi:hypothetical protein
MSLVKIMVSIYQAVLSNFTICGILLFVHFEPQARCWSVANSLNLSAGDNAASLLCSARFSSSNEEKTDTTGLILAVFILFKIVPEGRVSI